MFGFEKWFGKGEEEGGGKYDRYTLVSAFDALVPGDKVDPDNIFEVLSSAGLIEEEKKLVVEASSVEGALAKPEFDAIRTKVNEALANLKPEEAEEILA